VSGHEELIKLYDLRTKKACGELSGEHSQNVTCLQATQKHVLSGSEDGTIIIWRYE